jgi:hypothetical protein
MSSISHFYYTVAFRDRSTTMFAWTSRAFVPSTHCICSVLVRHNDSMPYLLRLSSYLLVGWPNAVLLSFLRVPHNSATFEVRWRSCSITQITWNLLCHPQTIRINFMLMSSISHFYYTAAFRDRSTATFAWTSRAYWGYRKSKWPTNDSKRGHMV